MIQIQHQNFGSFIEFHFINEVKNIFKYIRLSKEEIDIFHYCIFFHQESNLFLVQIF